MTLEHCPAFCLLSPGRRVRCVVPDLEHDQTAHVGMVRVILPDGRERVATVLWSGRGRDRDEDTDLAD